MAAHRPNRSRKDAVENLQAAGWDLTVAAILIIMSASVLLLAVLPPVIALLHR